MRFQTSHLGKPVAHVGAGAKHVALTMAQISSANFCRLLRTKFSYFRAPGGERLIDPDSTTACYTCLLTQRPVGPDGMPVHADTCGADRDCFSPES